MLELQVSSEDFIRVANASVQHGKSRASTNMSLVMTIWVVALRTVGNAVSNTPSSPILALLHLVHSLSKIEKRFSIELTGYKRHMSRSGLSSSALYSRKPGRSSVVKLLQKMHKQESLARQASVSNSPTSRYHGEDDEDVSGDDPLMILFAITVLLFVVGPLCIMAVVVVALLQPWHCHECN